MAKSAAKQEVTPVIRGDRYRRTHRASVIGVLGKMAPPVYSRGSLFYNMDRWTARALVSEMCQWAEKNKDCTPTKKDVASWVLKANQISSPDRCIVIANTPDKLPVKVALGLTGGAYHEAFHTKYSCRRDLDVQECANILLPRWAKVKDWSRLHQALQEWNNIVEDIRIERRGREEYEGSHTKLADLQDFILDMEAKGIEHVRSHGGKPGALSVIVRAFRDIGLGYNTTRQQEVFAEYRQDNQEAVDLVMTGPLAPMLQESIDMSAQDDLGCIRVAMDVVAKLAELGGVDESDDKAQDGQQGDGKQSCPSCGAPASKIIVRPLSDGHGGKVKGKGVATCTVCGHQEEVDVRKKTSEEKAKDKADKQKNKKQQGPKFEGFDESDFDDDSEGDGSDQSGEQDGEGSSGSNGNQSGDEQGDGESNGSGEGEQDGEGTEGGKGEDGREDSTSDKSKDGENDASGVGDRDDESGSDGSNEDKQGDSQTCSSDLTSTGAGGHCHEQGPHEGNNFQWENVAGQALADAQCGEDTHTLDNNTALEDAVNAAEDREDKDLQTGEAPWAPYNPGLDKAILVRPSRHGKEHDMAEATRLVKSVTSESAYTRARLRNIVRALEMTSTVHGVPTGRSLSSRYLVDSKAALKGKQIPKKAYYRKGIQMDMSMAAAVVVDESGSIARWLRDAARIMISITEPLDALNCPTLALGLSLIHI